MNDERFRKGDLVRFRLGIRSIQGVVKEERRRIEVKGRNGQKRRSVDGAAP